MIYIDPPYNTGNDFVYHDDFHRTQAEEDLEAGNVDELGNRFVKNTETNGKFHSDWCSMIYPRLQLAHSLLSEDGVIFISMDDNEIENLRKLCDEIFGEENFIAQICWRRTDNQLNIGYFAKVKEYILLYSKTRNFTLGRLPLSEKAKAEYRYSDEKGLFRRSILLHKTRGRRFYPKVTKLGNTLNGPWMVSEEEFDKMDKNGEIYWTENGDGQPYGKIYLSKSKGQIPNDFWGIEFGTNQRGSLEVEKLFGKRYFDFPKPVSLIQNICKLGSDKDSIILDFFSGSATTAQAVMQLNAEDGGHRKFILVQLPEETDVNSEAYKAGYKNICEIGEERIRRAGKKIKEELQGAALVAVRNGKSSQGDLFDQGNQQTDGHEGRTLQADDLDTGFRVFRVDSSNMKDVYFAPKDLEPQQLDLFADNVKEDRTELDLLYGCMVDWGVPLSLPLSEETIDVADGHTMATDDGTIADGHKGRTLQADGNGVTVYTVNDGDLVACFGKPITDNVVKAMADKAPLRVLFRDSCFEKDEQKINIFEQFKQLLGWSDDEALNNIRVI